MTDERKAFEAWAQAYGVSTWHSRVDPQKYATVGSQDAWSAWQAATAAEKERTARIAEKYFHTTTAKAIRKG